MILLDPNWKRPLGYLFLTLVLMGCGSEKPNQNANKSLQTIDEKISKLEKPKNGSQFKINEQLPILVSIDEQHLTEVDSIAAFLGKKRLCALQPGIEATVALQKVPLGKQQLLIKVFTNSGKTESKIANIMLLSHVKPPIYTYDLVAEYPHNTGSYTQGLLFHDGFLYESTGLRKESSLLKVDINTGDFLQVHHLPDTYFGEGLTLFGDQLIQITWQAETGFVYDLESFKLVRSFSYSGQGWGITHDETRLIMSNGSNRIAFLDPETFREIGAIQVMDDQGPVDLLNELEYVNGEIWANYYEYQTFKIVRISPATGQVLGYVNLTGILDRKDMHPDIDVLNGIAYDAENDRLFVTGKKWPKLYEIKIKG